MNKLFRILLIILLFSACKNDDTIDIEMGTPSETFISAVDISRFPEISSAGTKFYNTNGELNSFLNILKNSNINTIRLRLWVNPNTEHSGFNEVKEFSKRLKELGFNIWLTLHYSDTWADPGQQKIPSEWMGLSFSGLNEKIYSYTKNVMEQINPEFVQIGNEINNGILHPEGHITNNYIQFSELIQSGIKAVREHSQTSKIILHFAGIDGADWFFNQVKTFDYDIIGLSYYPIWHGKSIAELETKMNSLATTHNKQILIAETAYPFTLDWNDWTNNIVGLQEHLILPEYPASKEGQRLFVKKMKTICNKVQNGIGFCYWGGELVAWKGTEGIDASPWENQALFDFNNKTLPVLNEF
ncbi:glycoside hydrolase, family GH53 lipoprotein precursor. Putative arabinogalactan endo-beta-1,4-galactanase [Tenacibaculum sp. 190130A14a]|uniref:Arabinogalactan endo-beta-1,4-galactanase n=1 Tax=Tenacibaculum polynesiense TaxID=3137857 RepID=A0ABM9PC86_9FLAO